MEGVLPAEPRRDGEGERKGRDWMNTDKRERRHSNRNDGLGAPVWEEGENLLGLMQLCPQVSHQDSLAADWLKGSPRGRGGGYSQALRPLDTPGAPPKAGSMDPNRISKGCFEAILTIPLFTVGSDYGITTSEAISSHLSTNSLSHYSSALIHSLLLTTI